MKKGSIALFSADPNYYQKMNFKFINPLFFEEGGERCKSYCLDDFLPEIDVVHKEYLRVTKIHGEIHARKSKITFRGCKTLRCIIITGWA